MVNVFVTPQFSLAPALVLFVYTYSDLLDAFRIFCAQSQLSTQRSLISQYLHWASHHPYYLMLMLTFFVLCLESKEYVIPVDIFCLSSMNSKVIDCGQFSKHLTANTRCNPSFCLTHLCALKMFRFRFIFHFCISYDSSISHH